jgi:hypothetical protein
LNPATRKKIEYLCGSIEAFCKDPSILHGMNLEPNYKWMRTVTVEEGQNCLTRMELWANSESKKLEGKPIKGNREPFESRVFQPVKKWEADLAGEPGLDFAKNPWCAQYLWGKDTYFPLCPKYLRDDTLLHYQQALKSGLKFAYKDDPEFPDFIVVKSDLSPSRSMVVVMCERSDGCWAIAGIEQNEKRFCIHFYYGSYLNKNEAEKAFVSKLKSDEPWEGNYFMTWDPV